jgi:hypothetical protein
VTESDVDVLTLLGGGKKYENGETVENRLESEWQVNFATSRKGKNWRDASQNETKRGGLVYVQQRGVLSLVEKSR